MTGNHISFKHGNRVFDNEEDAVVELKILIKRGSIPDATLQGMIDKLVHADRILAETAIADAVAARGNSHKIADARQELAKAASELARGHYDDAIDHYENAWKKAEEAIR